MGAKGAVRTSSTWRIREAKADGIIGKVQVEKARIKVERKEKEAESDGNPRQKVP